MNELIKKYDKFLRNKRVAVVSCASHMVDYNYGKLIDSYDVVVRFNQSGFILNKFKKYLGIKTNIIYSSFNANHLYLKNVPSELKKNKRSNMPINELIKNGLKWISSPTSAIKDRINDFNKRVNKGRIPIYTVPSQCRQELIEFLDFDCPKCTPTTGMMAIYDLLKYDVAELYITGFTFYQKVPGSDGSFYFADYQDPLRGPGRSGKKGKPPSKQHPPNFEFAAFKKMCNSDSRIKYDDILNLLLK